MRADFPLSRRAFLALSASGLSLGAVGYFSAPANLLQRLPPHWGLLNRALQDHRLGLLDYAHLAFAPDRPTDLWGVLAILQDYAHWPRPQRVSVIADAAPEPGGPPIPFLGTIEINPRMRITVDSRVVESRTSAVSGSRGRLVIFPARSELTTEDGVESRSIAWRTYYEFTPPDSAAGWALDVCDALREAARRRAAVAFTDSGEIVPAPLRVS